MDESVFLARISRTNRITSALLFVLSCCRGCVWVYAGLVFGLECAFLLFLLVHVWLALQDYWLCRLFDRYFRLGG